MSEIYCGYISEHAQKPPVVFDKITLFTIFAEHNYSLLITYALHYRRLIGRLKWFFITA